MISYEPNPITVGLSGGGLSGALTTSTQYIDLANYGESAIVTMPISADKYTIPGQIDGSIWTWVQGAPEGLTFPAVPVVFNVSSLPVEVLVIEPMPIVIARCKTGYATIRATHEGATTTVTFESVKSPPGYNVSLAQQSLPLGINDQTVLNISLDNSVSVGGPDVAISIPWTADTGASGTVTVSIRPTKQWMTVHFKSLLPLDQDRQNYLDDQLLAMCDLYSSTGDIAVVRYDRGPQRRLRY